MPFPISVAGTIEIPRESILSGDIQLLKRRTVEALELLTDTVTEDGMTVRSRPHVQEMFRRKVGNWHPMVAFDDIDVEIVNSFSGTVINYRFSITFALRFVAVGSVMFFLFGAMAHSWLEGARLAGMAFGWVFGVNYLLGWLRGPRWLKRQLFEPKAGLSPLT